MSQVTSIEREANSGILLILKIECRLTNSTVESFAVTVVANIFF